MYIAYSSFCLNFLSDPVVSVLDKKGKVPRAELLTEITKLKEEIVGKFVQWSLHVNTVNDCLLCFLHSFCWEGEGWGRAWDHNFLKYKMM